MTTATTPPSSCDYLVVGGGATGMAFADSLLHGAQGLKPSVVVLDKHVVPGGQWNDSYEFVQLHQPSAMYGVETVPLEPKDGDQEHRATRQEILDYYQRVADQLAHEFEFFFVGSATLDLHQTPQNNNTYTYTVGDKKHEIQVQRRLVDARYLQPDLPVDVPPTFDWDRSVVHCVPVNALVEPQQSTTRKYFVVLGAGKTGMDAVYHLLTRLQIPPSHIVWVMPHEPWITARENIGSCLQFLQTATTIPDLDLQKAFQLWELEGKIHRFVFGHDDSSSSSSLPTKFQDATLSKDELKVLQSIPTRNLARGKGRVAAIQNDGSLLMEDNTTVVELPFPNVQDITYVHCSAGAFNYTKQIGSPPRPVFESTRITLQDVYGTPGFCFVGSILGKLESISRLTDEQRNAMCLAPDPSQAPSSKLGFTTSGTVGSLSASHGYVQRLLNVRQWLQVPELRHWLIGHRLFNLGHYPNAEAVEQMVEEIYAVLKAKNIVAEE
jgi:L-lysine 6-monooxygenase (NADPH-requiring)/NAD(P)-binding Rossmann-like domain